MPAGRPAIPAQLDRAIRIEAGHRCAVTTCRSTSALQIHHIKEWAKVRSHSFENLILVCATCHSRITSGEIDRKSVRAYKANLGLLNGRYSDLERRVVERFVKEPDRTEIVIDKSHAILLDYLVVDGLLVLVGPAIGAMYFGEEQEPAVDELPAGLLGPVRWRLTPEGRTFIERLRQAQSIE